MKKLIFLLLALVVWVGLVVAGPVHPPGAPAMEIALSGYGVHEAAVTPDTVLAEPVTIVLPASFVVVPLISDGSGDQAPWYTLIKPIDTGQSIGAVYREPPGHWLRL
jgi:hypothetical protein